MVVPSLLPPAGTFLHDRLLLFCVPYAGASASVYRDWVLQAPEFLQVCPVELPGKGRLIREPFANSLDTLARAISEEVSAYADRPYAIFGHSMGALLTYEVAVQLESAGQPHPFKIFLSGALPPFSARKKRMVSDLPNAPFLDHLGELQGTPDAVLNNQELMQFFLPVLRSDFRLCEEYVMCEPRLLRGPVTALSGEQDEKTPEADMLLWKRATRGAFESRRYPGDHFFFTNPNVMWSMFDSLKGWQGQQHMAMAEASVRGA
jgi:medium-chain acyl-[acyl-carrier-protein] hydrolase